MPHSSSTSSETNLEKLTPPGDLTREQQRIVFEHIYRRLASHRNDVERYTTSERFACPNDGRDFIRNAYTREVNKWANELLEHAWMACGEPGDEKPTIDPLTDTSLRDLPPLPEAALVARFLNTVLLLHITSTKHYSAHARHFLTTFPLSSPAPGAEPVSIQRQIAINEDAATQTLKNPKQAVKDAEAHAKAAKEKQAKSNRVWRAVGVGSAAIIGGVLVGVTGGLAAPLVGASVSTVLGILGVGGSAAGVLAAGLAGSTAVCGALFGVYGAKRGAEMIERHTRDVRDLEVKPVRKPRETLAVRLCISGWLRDKGDVTAPWTIFDDSEDTLALQWEVQALEELSTALGKLVKSHAIALVRTELIRHTFLAAVATALAPVALIKLGQLVDNPWANSKALAIKTGHVLASLLSARAFGTRPVTLTGYSLGALVILTALEDLAEMNPEESDDDRGEGEDEEGCVVHLVQDVFLLGTPAPAAGPIWSRARRVVAGRLVNVYTDAESDYVLAFLQRTSLTDTVRGSLGVAGLQEVEVAGVENVKVEGVEGHVAWRGKVGRCLWDVDARGVRIEEVEFQERIVGEEMQREIEEGSKGGDTADYEGEVLFEASEDEKGGSHELHGIGANQMKRGQGNN